MNTYERATFALDELGKWQGVHNPETRWNGFACPLFTLDTCREIATVVNDELAHSDEFVKFDGDRVFTVYVGNGEEEVEEVLPIVVKGVPMFPLGSHGWVWDCVEFDCPVCETMAHEWDTDGCSCWWCPSCKVTNPQLNSCECGQSRCYDCGAIGDNHARNCFVAHRNEYK